MSYFWNLRRVWLAAAWTLAILGSGPALQANVAMPAIFGDHMVLQQESVLPLWGTADPGEKITVKVGDKTAETTAGADGKWRVKLEPLATAVEPVTLTVSGKNTLTFTDVLIGEVWICSGQSNMEFPAMHAHDAGEEIPKATDTQLRFFKIPHIALIAPGTEVVGKWEVCTPATVKGFSAVGYFFGRDLRATLKRPVGVIQSAWSGTPAQAWTPLEGLKKDPELQEFVEKIEPMRTAFAQANEAYPALQAAYEKDLADWKKETGATYTPILDAWKKEAAAAQAAKQPVPPMPQPDKPRPRAPDNPNGTGSTPTALYNGMIAPLIPYAIKGVIWYQGESNAGKAAQYKVLFSRMITEWRQNWGQGDFTFLFVQLAAFEKNEGSWAWLRESQFLTLALPRTGMATAVDIGEAADIHPRDKTDVGSRLALSARHVAYGESLVYSGPVYESMKVEGSAIRIHFTSTGGGLVISSAPWLPEGVEPLPSDKLVGFTIAGDDKNWVEAEAKIDGQEIVVSSPAVPHPVAVRYLWKDYPRGNLYNAQKLPALPFRTDSWPQPELTPPPAK